MSKHSDKVFFVDWLEVFFVDWLEVYLVAEMNQLKCSNRRVRFNCLTYLFLFYWLYRILAFFMNISASFWIVKYS